MIGPRGMDSRSSITQLVGHYESLEKTSTVPHSTTTPTQIITPTFRKNDKSPLRQSFRNLVGLIKKAQGKVKRSQHSVSPSIIQVAPVVEALPSSATAKCASPLLYLSRSSNAKLLPVWTSCQAVLDGDKLLVSWSTTHDNPDSLLIDLKCCTDVRSLSSREMESDEVSSLPAGKAGTEVKVFEIVMADNSREKFGASSNTDRAGWVSAIWEVVLLLQDVKNSARPVKSGGIAVPTYSEPMPQERNLPAIPSEPSIQDILEHQPAPARPKSPMQQNLLPSENVFCRTTSPNLSKHSQYISSPSIANLNQRSMVRQRLAEMKRNFSLTSLESPVDAPHLHFNSSPRAEVQPSDSAGTANDSIVDAYIEAPSAIPEYHARLANGSLAVARRDIQVIPEDAIEYDVPNNSLSSKITSLHQDVQNLNRSVDRLLQSRESTEWQSIHDILKAIGNLAEDNTRKLSFVNGNLERVAEHLTPAASTTLTKETVLGSIEVIRNTLISEVVAVSDKLDSMICQPSSLPQSGNQQMNSDEQLAKISTLLAEESNQRALHGQQQADSVRYLNELNSWLEAFVKNGTSQIQTMAITLQQLCEVVGVVQGSAGQPTGLLGDIRRIAQIIESRERGDHLDPGSVAPSQKFLEFMTQYRQEQENLLRALTGGLSSEIKGERLRFVEAMKEATAINVHNHVEEFKKQLKCEVQGMTQEVSRLYREKQTLENQIADLLDFKRKAASGGMVAPAQSTRHMQQHFHYSPSNPHLRRV
ncbi:hypothetical protein VKT23_000717 [Stygiomarasmius scandens]|uniref:PH domain-containing protein n=1 Tax=Marasmiellus scandens TaxID=2682957 RepID=A0ABR1K5A3_9AGAR